MHQAEDNMKYLTQNLSIPWGTGPGDTATIKGPLGDGAIGGGAATVGGLLSSAMKLVFLFGGVGLLLMLLAGGFTFLTSAGDMKKLEKGKQQITNAILGFIIIYGAYWAVQILGFIFGFEAIDTIFS